MISVKKLIQGKNIGIGILYCGKRYTTNGYCKCGNCDRFCGPTKGRPCPECNFILSYLLYSTGKMKCGNCNSQILYRLSLNSIRKITGRYTSGSIYSQTISDKYTP